MRPVLFTAGLLAFTSLAAFGQVTDENPTFEVASVKPSAPMTDGRIRVMMRGGPGSPDPGQLTYTNVSLKNILQNAYNVKGYQISGPGWLDSQRFDIAAKIPKGATKEQFQKMLQNLLAERFKLVLHHETKDLPMYALVVGKNGPKLKESAKEDPAAAAAAASAPPPPMDGARIKVDKDGKPQLPPGMGKGGMMMMMSPNGLQLTANGVKLGALVEMLSNQMGRPVTDETKLTGDYDISLSFAPENMGGPLLGVPQPPPPAGAEGGPMHAGGGPESGGAPTLSVAVQEQLGLKMESKKGPVDLLVIDSMEKVPTEN
jgi:uncharacterized protein (TIGR03435 family)